MSIENEPGVPAGTDPAHAERHARAFGYMYRVLTTGETPPCDAGTGAMLAGMVLGQRCASLTAAGMTLQAATAAGVQWVADQAALWGSMAAADQPPGPGAPPETEAARSEAARFALAEMDGQRPPECPEWLPRVLAAMLRSALVAGYTHAGDGMSRDLAVGATRAKLTSMAEGNG